MIAHKKQFKIAGAIWLVIVMTICQVVPAFASEVVSLNSLYAYCRVTSDSSSTLYLITRFITSSFDYSTYTYTVTIPYTILSQLGEGNNAYISALYFYIGDSSSLTFDSVYYYSADLELDYSIVNDQGSMSGDLACVSRLQDYVSVRPDTSVSAFVSFNEPFTYSKSFDSVNNSYLYIGFSNFLAFGQVSFTFSISLTLNDVKVNLDNASSDLGDLAEDLAVPTPDVDAIFNGMDDAINHVNDSNYQSTYSFFQNDSGIMATYITIVLAMATLGYIFFGKRSA